MLNFGKKFRALRDKKIYSNSCVVRKNQILNETKKHNPPPTPFKLNDRSLNGNNCERFSSINKILKFVDKLFFRLIDTAWYRTSYRHFLHVFVGLFLYWYRSNPYIL